MNAVKNWAHNTSYTCRNASDWATAKLAPGFRCHLSHLASSCSKLAAGAINFVEDQLSRRERNGELGRKKGQEKKRA